MTSALDSLNLHPMVKIEVVVNGTDVAGVRAIFEQVGVSGFTMLGNVAGLGHGGFHEGRLAFNDRDGLTLLLSVAPPDLAVELVAGLRVLFAERPGVMFITETRVSRPDYFSNES